MRGRPPRESLGGAQGGGLAAGRGGREEGGSGGGGQLHRGSSLPSLQDLEGLRMVSQEDKRRAEELKVEGNLLFAKGKFQAAAEVGVEACLGWRGVIVV